MSAISAGAVHSCATISTGGIKCWGGGVCGQLGDGTTADSYVPVDVSGISSRVSSISAAGNHSCALLSTGGIKCWGKNNHGQLGDGTTTNSNTPVEVSGLSSGAIAISSTYFHTCSLMSSGGVKCWGQNDYGQLGDGTTTDRNIPVNVSGLSSGVSQISAGWYITCALLSTGGIKCWGYNGVGGLGDGTTADRKLPVDVIGFGP
jgi:hypothetical protein